jgi:anti-sigma-K factor RskA
MMSKKLINSNDLAGAYALNALNDEDRELFEQLLAKSDDLRAETIELSDTATFLGASFPEEEPPAHLRTRILAQIENTPQLSPQQASATATTPGWQEKLAKRITSLRGAFIGLAAVGAAAVVAVVGVNANTQTHQVQASPIQNIQTAADYQKASVGTARGSVVVSWANSEQLAAVRVDDLLKISSTKTYELWITDADGKTLPAGTINGADKTWHVFKGNVSKGDMLRMTIEPQGGSNQPTGEPLFSVKV